MKTELRNKLRADVIAKLMEVFPNAVRVEEGLAFLADEIDEDYRGEVCVPVVNISNEAYTIQPQERIAQMVISKYEQAKIEVVTKLTETIRGEGGFGSTGK